MAVLLGFLKIIFLIGFLIFIHEGGHFLAAKFCKVKVEQFCIGFGPKIFTKKGKETQYSLALIPLGGFVEMAGEYGKTEEPRAFSKAKLWQRILIVIAGPMVNIVFALIVFFGLGWFTGDVPTNIVDKPVAGIENVSPNIISGDEICAINGMKVNRRNDMAKALSKVNENEEVTVSIIRNGENIEVKAKPINYHGMLIMGYELKTVSDTNTKDKLYYTFWETYDFGMSVFHNLKLLFTGAVGLDDMAGPIGISQVVATSEGVNDFIYLLCLISLSLGVMNLLPIPALDGGRLLLLIIEGIRGKALKEELEAALSSAGFILLILLSIIIACNDLMRLIKF